MTEQAEVVKPPIIEVSMVKHVRITNVPRLDPIEVVLQNFEHGRGRITINCWSDAWVSYWGSMGSTLEKFIISCDDHYIAKNLASGLNETITDGELIQSHALKEICRQRRESELKSRQARDLYDEVLETQFSDNAWESSKLMSEIFGDEWWYRMPSKPNPRYQYLVRIIQAVRNALVALEEGSERCEKATIKQNC